MISKILMIANPSKKSLECIIDAFQTIRKHQPLISMIFFSSLSGVLFKHLDPDRLALQLKEEKETIERAAEYFTSMGLPHSLKAIKIQSWQNIFHEIKVVKPDLIILQGDILKVLKGDTLHRECYYWTNFKPQCHILVIDHSEDSRFHSYCHTEIS